MKTKYAKRKKQRVEKNTLSPINEEYCFQMSRVGTNVYKPHWLELVPVAFFTAFVILIVRMHSYERDMSQFTWSTSDSHLVDLFSYFKMIAIVSCAVFSLLVLLFRAVNKQLALKKSSVYILFGIYLLFVLISYLLSDYKEFSLLGYNGRFEGTITIFSYAIMFIYILNTVNISRNVNWIIYPLTGASIVLGILGLAQFYGKDLFRSVFGQKLITANSDIGNGVLMNEAIDAAAEKGETFLSFNFDAGSIYQTVYNINYVSFYLALLIPLLGMLFVSSMKSNNRIIGLIAYGLSFGLSIFNMLGSESSGGIFGFVVALIFAIVYLNKQILRWWKPILALIVIACIATGITYSSWSEELHNTFSKKTIETETVTNLEKHTLNGIDIDGNNIIVTFDYDKLKIHATSSDRKDISVYDQNNKELRLIESNKQGAYYFDDKRFENCSIFGMRSNGYDMLLFTDNNYEMDWTFVIEENSISYINASAAITTINTAEAGLFKNYPHFGSGRGYIWSRSIPLMKDCLLFGKGADTFTIAFPQYDYVGKYNAGFYSMEKNIIVDKPHNMYLNMFITTGGISFIAFMGILILYFVECFKIYRRVEYDEFISYCGFGIFIGIIGFAVAGLVNDSSVSVMPMFYGLLGTGYAINAMLKKKIKAKEVEA